MIANYLEEIEDQACLVRYPRDYPLKAMSEFSEANKWRIVARKGDMTKRENPRFYDAVPMEHAVVVQEWKTKPDMRQISIHEFVDRMQLRLGFFDDYYTTNYPDERRDFSAWTAELEAWASGAFTKEIPSEAGRLRSAGGGEEGSRYKTHQEMLDSRAREMLERKQSSKKKVTQGPQEGERNQS